MPWQKQPAAFARALANEPEVILMDEPFSNLDPLTKQNLLIETKSLAKKTGTTVVLVTHDTRDAMEIADEIWVLHNGSIAQIGNPREVYQYPKTPQIALTSSCLPTPKAREGLQQGFFNYFLGEVAIFPPLYQVHTCSLKCSLRCRPVGQVPTPSAESASRAGCERSRAHPTRGRRRRRAA